MSVWKCELVLCVCVLLVGVLGIERVAKPVVFSYSSADLPHPATISHHYRGPVEPSPEQKHQSAGVIDGTPRNGQSSVEGANVNEGSYQKTPAYYNDRPPIDNYQPHSSVSSLIYDELQQDYDYVTVNPSQHYQSTTAFYYNDDRPSIDSNQYYQRPSAEPPVYDNHQQSYDHPTIKPDINYPSSTNAFHDDRNPHSDAYHPNYIPSTVSLPIYDDNMQDYDHSTPSSNDFHSATSTYYDDRSGDNGRDVANPSTVSPPVYNDNGQGYTYRVVNPDNSYHSTTVSYYDRSPSESYPTPPSSIPPIYDENNKNYDYSTPSHHFLSNIDGKYDSNQLINGPSSTSDLLPDYEMGLLSGNVTIPNALIETGDFSAATTQPTNSFTSYPSEEPVYPDQPKPPEFTKQITPPPKRRRVYSTTTNYYEDNEEYLSTRPIPEFESVKDKLPPVQDYPSPNPGYITRPFKQNFDVRTNQKRPRNGGRNMMKSGFKTAHHSDKVLQQPKYFAYSSDSKDGRIGDDMLRGGLKHHDEPASLEEMGQQDHHNQNQENHELDEDHHKKIEENYAKGGGQAHHSAHKETGGDKGDKGYKSSHKYSKGKKGHHDKEDHKGKYLDEKGVKAKKKDEGGHYGEHHRGETGKKAAKYGESGEHKKGHSTKGEHNIHKKDEYMKKHEFYDEHHEGGDHEKFGGFVAAHGHKKSGKKKKGHHKSGGSHHHKGKKGDHEKEEKKDHHIGHKDAKGYDGHFGHRKKHGKRGGHKEGKIWGYSKGHPK